MNDFPTSIDFEQVRAIVERVAAANRLSSERLAVSRTQGRILAQDVIAPMPLPAFDNSAMDGVALRHTDLAGEGDTVLKLVGEQFAGRSLDLKIEAGQCVRITTGAPIPSGADTVAIKEKVRVEDLHVSIPAGIACGANIRRCGEDVRSGDPVLEAGCVMTPVRMSLAAALGIEQLDVVRRPTVAVFTTGDELVEPCLPLRPGEIYNSNRELLMGLLRDAGLEPTAWPTLPDHPDRIAMMLEDAAASFDVVITCGAVSVGEKDHIPRWLQQHGRVHFWKVRMKPGMPLLFGQVGDAQFLGLPGNPISVLATWLTLGRVLTDGLQGRVEPRPLWRARLSGPIDKAHERREFMRGWLQCDDDGTLCVDPNIATGSHRLRAAAASNALIVLKEGAQRLQAGDLVETIPF